MAGAEPGQNRGIITVCVMMATIMQALDTTIANVALPYMQGNLSATQDQINWVLTSYIVAAAIATPSMMEWRERPTATPIQLRVRADRSAREWVWPQGSSGLPSTTSW